MGIKLLTIVPAGCVTAAVNKGMRERNVGGRKGGGGKKEWI